jgi:hypothetical protein
MFNKTCFFYFVMIIFHNHMFKVGTSRIHQNIDKNHNLQNRLQTTSKSLTNGPHQCKIIMYLNEFISHVSFTSCCTLQGRFLKNILAYR